MSLTPVAFSSLPGWQRPASLPSLTAFRRSCAVFSRRTNNNGWIGPSVEGGTLADWKSLCRELDRALPQDQSFDAFAFQAFLESRFQPYLVADEVKGPQGTFTGYFESELEGCLSPTPECHVPLYGPPQGLVSVDMGAKYADMKGVVLTGLASGDRIKPMPTRAEIETGALEGKAPIVAWVKDPVEAHILHIQGSGRIHLPDGGTVRVGYAGNNGLPFKGLGRILLDHGLLPPNQASMPAIRAWLQSHPQEAEFLMRENPRYIFFRILEGEGPVGAFGVALEPRHSLAVDTRYIALGLPLWLDVNDPDGESLQGLVFSQDVGSAIKGVVRGDFFWGPGEIAFNKAGRMKSTGGYYLLLPKSRYPERAS